MILSPLALTVLFGIGLLLVVGSYLPEHFTSPFVERQDEFRVTSIQRFQRKLRLAGYFDRSPSFFLFGMLIVGCVVGFLVAAATGKLILAPLGPVVVTAATLAHLTSRAHNSIIRASAEIVPFLRNIEAAVRSQMAAPIAYRRAVERSNALRPFLEPSVADMISGASFPEALRGTVERLPLKTWAIFVRQMELHERAGGPLAEALAETVKHLDMLVQLQSKARAQYSSQRMQQRIITAVSLGGILLFMLKIDREIASLLWTTPAGWLVLLIGGSIMSFGLWWGRRQLATIAEKLNL